MKRRKYYPVVDAALVEANGGFPNIFLSDEDREIAAGFNIQAEIYKVELVLLKEKFNQEPIAWLFPDIMMTTTSKTERDRWLKAGREVIDLIRKN